MTEENESDGQTGYQIKVQGRLDERWTDWFNGMTIASESGITTLTGAAIDQARLRGILSKIWDLNLTLISVTQIESESNCSACHSERSEESRLCEERDPSLRSG